MLAALMNQLATVSAALSPTLSWAILHQRYSISNHVFALHQGSTVLLDSLSVTHPFVDMLASLMNQLAAVSVTLTPNCPGHAPRIFALAMEEGISPIFRWPLPAPSTCTLYVVMLVGAAVTQPDEHGFTLFPPDQDAAP